MSDSVPQTYESHRRLIPLYHGAVGLTFTINLALAIWRLAKIPSADTVVAVLVAAALILLFFYARVFALIAQDRAIRIEERLRLQQLLPADLKPRIGELATGQLIALRFASDAELPDLTRKVIDEKIGSRDAIKKLIRNWRPDLERV